MGPPIPKLSLTQLSSGYRSTNALNSDFEAIEDALENTLSRDGTSPNQMEAELDMNSNRVINLPAPVDDNDAARKIDADNAVAGAAAAQAAAEAAAADAAADAALTAADVVTTAANVTAAGEAQTAAEAAQTGAETAETGAVAAQVAAEAAVATKLDLDAGNVVDAPTVRTNLGVDTAIATSAATKLDLDASNGTPATLRTTLSVPAIVTAEHYGSDPDTAVTAANTAGLPFYHDDPDNVARITIDPTTESTDVDRHAVIADAFATAAKSIAVDGAEIEVYCDSTGAIDVFGQISLDDFDHMSNSSPVTLSFPTLASRTLSTVTNPVFGTKEARVTHISVTNAGSGYTSAPTVVFTGGGGTGAAATAYVEGGVITGVVVTNGGSGFTSAPTISFTGGGGSGAVATAVVNLNIIPVDITFTADVSTMTVGQPFAIRDADGTGSVAALNGCHKIVGVSGSTVSIEITYPAGTPTAGAFTGGTAYFPTTWLNVKGGYTGSASGLEGYLNASNGRQLKLKNVFAVWGDGSAQAIKSNQSFLHIGRGMANIHCYNNSGATDFPGRAIRMNNGTAYVNRFYMGGGIYGQTGLHVQGGGFYQVVSSSIGSFKDEAILVGRGCFVNCSTSDIGAASYGVKNVGGWVDIQTSNIADCTIGADTSLDGFTYGGDDAAFDYCGVAISWDSGGKYVGEGPITNSVTSDTVDDIPQDVHTRGGGYFSTSTIDHGTTFYDLTISASSPILGFYDTDSLFGGEISGAGGHIYVKSSSNTRDVHMGTLSAPTLLRFDTSEVALYLSGTKVLGTQQAAVTKPTGGATVDAECRTALNSLIDKLGTLGHGLTANA